ncbi:hypothetical protein R1flu_025329 [Riccia fluitans]|uniref:Secreted protein n=1 Tax=Riccia fluitans TaxID=41844 RepID=A0ABD1XXG9_9MARC
MKFSMFVVFAVIVVSFCYLIVCFGTYLLISAMCGPTGRRFFACSIEEVFASSMVAIARIRKTLLINRNALTILCSQQILNERGSRMVVEQGREDAGFHWPGAGFACVEVLSRNLALKAGNC